MECTQCGRAAEEHSPRQTCYVGSAVFFSAMCLTLWLKGYWERQGYKFSKPKSRVVLSFVLGGVCGALAWEFYPLTYELGVYLWRMT